MGRDQWSWLHQRMHGELAGAVVRDSAAAVQQVGGQGAAASWRTLMSSIAQVFKPTARKFVSSG